MCIFCEIVNGNIPSKKVYEDDKYLGILDLSQTTKGHTLLMPKAHSDNFLAMDKDEFGKMMSVANTLANRIVKKMDAKGCNVLINTNEVAGQTIMHTHVHIIPRYDENDSIKVQFTENKYDLDEIMNQINDQD